MGVAAVLSHTFSAPLPHGINQGSKGLLRDGRPFLLQELGQLGHISGRRVVVSNSSTQDVPQVLYRCQVWRARWPVHAWDPLLLEEVSHHLGSMRRGVVVLESRTRTHGLESWLHNGADYLIQITLTSQRFLDDVQGVLPWR